MPENEENSVMKHTSINSSTSSDDSGVLVVESTARCKSKRAISREIAPAVRQKQQQESIKNKNSIDNRDISKTKNSTKINIQNFINIAKTAHDNAAQKQYNECCHDQGGPVAMPRSSSKTTSPTVSIRSTTISIVSIDEMADESSVVDSDSNIEADYDEEEAEDGELPHGRYIVKKLGQKTTYAPNSPDIPNIGNGLTVLGQYITPNTNLTNAEVVALPNKLINDSSRLGPPPPSTPQIGSIALSNSTDVTFGDKHFYEGPVTIQQFLIDHREKLKSGGATEGQDNPAFEQATPEVDPSIITKETPKQTHLLPFGLPVNRKAVFITTVALLLILFIGILLVTTNNLFKPTIEKSKKIGDGDDSRKNIPIHSNIDPDQSEEEPHAFNGTFYLVHRQMWQARAPKTNEMTKLNMPVHRIIISHTASQPCQSYMICVSRVQTIQSFHMDSNGWDDIGYNFLVGGDGLVFVGRGWDLQGAHTKGYNVDSIGISFIGTYISVKPTAEQLAAATLLINEGVRLGKLVPSYKLYGARQLYATESPGEALYKIIKKWTHWSAVI